MSFEEELIKLNEEKLFKSPKSIQIEENEFLTNYIKYGMMKM